MNTNTVKDLDQEARNAIAAATAASNQRRERELKLGKFSKAVSVAEAACIEFEAKKAFFIQRKTTLINQLPTFWAMQKGDLSLQINFDPLLGIVESWGTILAIDAALADAPRCKKHLDEQLRVAKQNLADFQRQK